jgi:hypothetical protein
VFIEESVDGFTAFALADPDDAGAFEVVNDGGEPAAFGERDFIDPEGGQPADFVTGAGR